MLGEEVGEGVAVGPIVAIVYLEVKVFVDVCPFEPSVGLFLGSHLIQYFEHPPINNIEGLLSQGDEKSTLALPRHQRHYLLWEYPRSTRVDARPIILSPKS